MKKWFYMFLTAGIILICWLGYQYSQWSDIWQLTSVSITKAHVKDTFEYLRSGMYLEVNNGSWSIGSIAKGRIHTLDNGGSVKRDYEDPLHFTYEKEDGKMTWYLEDNAGKLVFSNGKAEQSSEKAADVYNESEAETSETSGWTETEAETENNAGNTSEETEADADYESEITYNETYCMDGNIRLYISDINVEEKYMTVGVENLSTDYILSAPTDAVLFLNLTLVC